MDRYKCDCFDDCEILNYEHKVLLEMEGIFVENFRTLAINY